jgi:hypothetical protein
MWQICPSSTHHNWCSTVLCTKLECIVNRSMSRVIGRWGTYYWVCCDIPNSTRGTLQYTGPYPGNIKMSKQNCIMFFKHGDRTKCDIGQSWHMVSLGMYLCKYQVYYTLNTIISEIDQIPLIIVRYSSITSFWLVDLVFLIPGLFVIGM